MLEASSGCMALSGCHNGLHEVQRGGRAALNPPDETDEVAMQTQEAHREGGQAHAAWDAVAMRFVVV